MSDSVIDPPWKKLKLSLERPYRDDSGAPIPVLFDITSDGQHIYETTDTVSERLGITLRRIFAERGPDFFDKKRNLLSQNNPLNADEVNEKPKDDSESDRAPKAMTMDELLAMRSKLLPHLSVALGEMSQAKDLLSVVLSGTQSIEGPSSLLSAGLVTKPQPIVSLRTFNAQLTIGNKDEALRKAAALFKAAAESMERSRFKGETYWVDALRMRKANWGLTPAPLPLSSTIGKGADKTSKDFIISYGLEGSPAVFRRRAIAQLNISGGISHHLLLPFRQNTRLKISLITKAQSSADVCSFDLSASDDENELEQILKSVQTEVVDQEIFSLLVKEAGNLPTASARVSERLIVIDAAQGLELTFELVDSAACPHQNPSPSNTKQNICELIYHVLRALLLRAHELSHADKNADLAKASKSRISILEPIIEILQYQVFCGRVEAELRKSVCALIRAGIPTTLTFTAVGEPGELLVSRFAGSGQGVAGGEAAIRVDNWHTLWFTFRSPAALTAHLSQSTITISSLPQLCQLLMDEVERCLLQRICTLGRELKRHAGGIWFVDLNRCVGKWEGCVLNFRVYHGENFDINCSAFRLDSTTSQQGDSQNFAGGIPLLTWVHGIIANTSSAA